MLFRRRIIDKYRGKVQLQFRSTHRVGHRAAGCAGQRQGRARARVPGKSSRADGAGGPRVLAGARPRAPPSAPPAAGHVAGPS